MSGAFKSTYFDYKAKANADYGGFDGKRHALEAHVPLASFITHWHEKRFGAPLGSHRARPWAEAARHT